jgi:hypothetical protein
MTTMGKKMKTVYFIQRGEDGPIKIGSTGLDPRHRLAALQIGSAERLRLLGYLQSKETEIHSLFSEHRLSGEWFRPHQDILEFVRTRTIRSISDTKKQPGQLVLRITRTLYGKIVKKQQEAKKLTGFEPAISEVARQLIERGLEANGKRR